jgi:protein SCO1/2
MDQERFLKIGAALSAFALALTAFWVFTRPPRMDLPDYGEAPNFSLTTQDGQLFDSGALKGKVWIASFVYSTCKSSCPMLASQLKHLYKDMPPDEAFELISVTVDPDVDTPMRLQAYAKELGVADHRWLFLTGKKAYIKSLINDGFRLVADPSVRSDDNEIMHSTKLVLVDTQGHIRGYFDGTLSESGPLLKGAAEQLLHDAKG